LPRHISKKTLSNKGYNLSFQKRLTQSAEVCLHWKLSQFCRLRGSMEIKTMKDLIFLNRLVGSKWIPSNLVDAIWCADYQGIVYLQCKQKHLPGRFWVIRRKIYPRAFNPWHHNSFSLLSGVRYNAPLVELFLSIDLLDNQNWTCRKESNFHFL